MLRKIKNLLKAILFLAATFAVSVIMAIGQTYCRDETYGCIYCGNAKGDAIENELY